MVIIYHQYPVRQSISIKTEVHWLVSTSFYLAIYISTHIYRVRINYPQQEVARYMARMIICISRITDPIWYPLRYSRTFIEITFSDCTAGVKLTWPLNGFSVKVLLTLNGLSVLL